MLFNDLNPDGAEPCGPVSGDQSYDKNGHGSHTGGIIVADGGYGIAPGARLISARIWDHYQLTTHEITLAAMQWMLDPDGNPETDDLPQIVSCSWGAPSNHGDDPEELWYYEVVENWVAAGILPVFAAGNSGPMSHKVDFPACFRMSWAVAGIKSNDSLAMFSSPGPATWNGETYTKPDIAGPGKNIISVRANGGLCEMDGTSVATPHAAGVAALVLQANPHLTPAEIRTAIEEAAVDLGSTGKDSRYGAGKMDALAAITKLVGQTPLSMVFGSYDRAVRQDQFYTHTTHYAPLSAPLATYLSGRVSELSATELPDAQANPLYKPLLRAGRSMQTFDRVHSSF